MKIYMVSLLHRATINKFFKRLKGLKRDRIERTFVNLVGPRAYYCELCAYHSLLKNVLENPVRKI